MWVIATATVALAQLPSVVAAGYQQQYLKPARPRNPTNLTVFGLRPYNLSQPMLATNYDWGDAAGDIFFLMTDVLSLPYACSVSHNSWWACGQRGALGHDQVYTQLVLEVDGDVLRPDDGTLNGATYSDCNPDKTGAHFHCDCVHPDSSWSPVRASPAAASAQLENGVSDRCDFGPAYSQCHDVIHRNVTHTPNMSACVACFTAATGCTRGAVWDRCGFESTKVSCEIFGAEPIDTRYCGARRSKSNLSEACPACADGCSGVWDHWKSSAARVLGGNWFSTAQEGNCNDPTAPGCGWRALEHVKTVNATCANDNLITAVEYRGAECFKNGACQKLGDSNYNRSTNCWVKCFFSTVLGPTPHLNASSLPWTPLPAMTSEELTGPWLAAFQSEDDQAQGCPALPPPTTPARRR